MTTASSMRSAWEKLSASTCSATTESGLLVMLPSELNADPIRVPIATSEAARIKAQTAKTRHGCRAETRARDCVIDEPPAFACCPLRSFERVANMSSSSRWNYGLVRFGQGVHVYGSGVGLPWEAIHAARTLSGWSD